MSRLTLLPLAFLMLVAGCSGKPASESEMSFLPSAKPAAPTAPQAPQAPQAAPVVAAEGAGTVGVPPAPAMGAGSPTAPYPYVYDEANGFSIALPPGWGAISAEALAERGRLLSGPGLTLTYVAGFQVQANHPFATPLILVRRMPESLMPKSSLKTMRSMFSDNQDAIAQQIEKQSGIGNLGLSGMKMDFGAPVLEEETGIVWLKVKIEANGQKTEGLVAHYYVGGEIYQFNAATSAERSAQDWPILEPVLRTIQIGKR